jgi:hypothetical protein
MAPPLGIEPFHSASSPTTPSQPPARYPGRAQGAIPEPHLPLPVPRHAHAPLPAGTPCVEPQPTTGRRSAIPSPIATLTERSCPALTSEQANLLDRRARSAASPAGLSAPRLRVAGPQRGVDPMSRVSTRPAAPIAPRLDLVGHGFATRFPVEPAILIGQPESQEGSPATLVAAPRMASPLGPVIVAFRPSTSVPLGLARCRRTPGALIGRAPGGSLAQTRGAPHGLAQGPGRPRPEPCPKCHARPPAWTRRGAQASARLKMILAAPGAPPLMRRTHRGQPR